MNEKDPHTDVLDTEILEAALEAQEEGQSGPEALLRRFPDRPEAVRAVERALRSYRGQVQRERTSPSSSEQGDLLGVGTLLGDYRIEGLLGSGGMGVVYRATQVSEGHQVAVKVLRPEIVERDRSAVGRFHREAELLVDVVHPNLARTFGTCIEGERVYFAMELVEGRPLGDVLQRLARVRQLGGDRHERFDYVRQIVRLVSKVARALAAIHDRNLIHRDVKPSNIMLRGAGDDDLRALDCEPVLVDHGLLRPVEPSDLTSSQTLLGTPAFVSPEARLGRVVDARGDVFSLGVVLYDLLTLTAPGRRRIASSGLSDVSLLNPAVDKRLSAIVARAMEDRPALRYANGAAFERELNRYLKGKSIHALPRNPLARLWLVARRRPTQAAVGGSVLAVLLVGSLVLAGGEVRRGLKLRTLVQSALQLEQTGQLYDAWQSWNALPAQAGLLDGLFGVKDELEWAKGYWGGEFGRVCARMATGGESEQGHEALRKFLLSSSQDGEHFGTVLRFLTHELGVEDQHRVRSAAKTAAVYLTIRPRGWGEALTDEALDRELENALVGLAAGEGPASDSSEARYYATSALSGFPRPATFRTLVALLNAKDPELGRLSLVGLLRQCYLAWKGEREREISPALLDSWLTALANSEQQHAQRADMFVTYQYSLHALVDTYLAQGAALPEQLRSGHPEFAQYMDDLVRAHQGASEGHDPIVPVRLSLTSYHAVTTVSSNRLGTHGRASPFESYTNLWRGDSVAGEERQFPWDRTAHTFSFSLDVNSRSNFEAHLDHSPMTSVRWTGAVLQLPREGQIRRVAGYLELNSPIAGSQVTFTCPVPEQAHTAKVTLKHEAAARWFMPYQGKSQVEARVRDDEPALLRAVSVDGEEISFSVPRQQLELSDELEFTVQFVSGTTVYWLREVVVEFMGEGL